MSGCFGSFPFPRPFQHMKHRIRVVAVSGSFFGARAKSEMDDQIQYLDAQVRSPLVEILSAMMDKRVGNQLEFIARSLDRAAEVKKSTQTPPTRDSVPPCSEKCESSGHSLAPTIEPSLDTLLAELAPDIRDLIAPCIMRLSEWDPERQLEQFAHVLEEASVSVVA